MEKGFKGLAIPFPEDPDNIKADIDAKEKTAAVESAAYVAELRKSITLTKDVVTTLDAMPPLDQITKETYFEMFPDEHENYNESFFPFAEEFQGDLSENNKYGRSTTMQEIKGLAYKALKYIPGIPKEAQYKPDPEYQKRTKYM